METYTEMKTRHRERINELPIMFAFSVEQFDEAMSKLGLTVEDTDKIYKMGSTGGFYRRTDSPLIMGTLNECATELDAAMENPDFAYDAFLCELGNHEYHINTYQGDWDVCSCFGDCEYGAAKDYVDYLKEIGYGSQVIRAFELARVEYYRQVEANGWW